MADQSSAGEMLQIADLSIGFASGRGITPTVDRISLAVGRGEIIGLIGESGSGKTLTALAILGLLPRGARVTGGAIRLEGVSLLDLAERQRRDLRGSRIAFIPQDALRALNPGLRVGTQVGEPLVIHRAAPWRAALAKAVDLLGAVHLREPARRAAEYPHQFSGGMQQRAMVAMGLALEPRLLIADEPTTALDVTVQAQVLHLLREIRDTHDTSVLFITHDLGIVAELCYRVYVMYAGTIVEQGPVRALFARPAHPYTQALLRATPSVHAVTGELAAIPGQIPSPRDWPAGCRFSDRCPLVFARCGSVPPLIPVAPGHHARCWRAEP
jgi:oligopeptide transport system ATP-binding protein